MKQLVQNYRSGELILQEVPVPQLRPGGVLVRNAFSLISAGTEQGQVDFARKNLLEKARARPDLVRKVLDKAHTEGVFTAYRKAMQRLDQPLALGYSCAGVVERVGDEIRDIAPGHRVACAGLGFASHAEIVYVPRHLCVHVPDGLDLAQAAYVTLGAIALEGIRVADVRLGESVVVIGLGLLGLLSIQLLKASGCRVFGIDIDASKVSLALELGADGACVRTDESLKGQVAAFTSGHGSDAVVVTAATPSSDPVELAGEIARDRAVVSVVGITGMKLPRKVFYEKSLQLRMSRSYGPGRYDRLYEEKGQDYPIGYVRWTENRNMQAFLQLVAEKKVDVHRLTTHTFEIERALDAYDLILGKRKEPYIGILLKYSPEPELLRQIKLRSEAQSRLVSHEAIVRIGVIGAGAFATSVLLPALGKAGVRFRGIATQSGMTARSAADRFGFDYCTSDPEEIISDSEIDAILILTRPASHAELVIQALQHSKHVFVEKPLATDMYQLYRVAKAYRDSSGLSTLMVGFNRRHSPFGIALQQFFAGHAQPLAMLYRVNAGALEPNDWQLDPDQGGGRLIGECGHFVDLMSFVSGENPESVYGSSAGIEDVMVTVKFSGGSIGTLAYITRGSPAFGKERLEVFGEGGVGILDDFRRLELVRSGCRKSLKSRLRQDKGHVAEIKTFLRTIQGIEKHPPSFESALLTTLTTLKAAEAIRVGAPQLVSLATLLDDDKPA
ncbi:MAG: Gfo/Idh/MocA family oxidoreductase [Syntrophaceae bacterium]|nr:Gfo/Idh/MocA family oxidoreductase [Syntrophaceae bacterium]